MVAINALFSLTPEKIMKRTLLASLGVLALVALAWADNYRQPTAGGTVTTFKSTDTAGVHVPHVNIDSASVLTTPTLGITPTDRTITSASGASQTLMAANASRHSLTVMNTGNANCGVNPTGGTAAIGGAGTITLAPLGSYAPRIPTLSAVTVICTAGQPVYADEN